MNESTEIQNFDFNKISGLVNADFIEQIVDKSDSFMKRIRVYFKNGHELSIIRGHGSFGGEQGLFEIRPSDESFFDENDQGDSVLGYLNPDRVIYYINKIGSIK